MSDQEQDPAELVEVLASIDPMQVRMAHDMLASNGIESFIFDEDWDSFRWKSSLLQL